MRWCLMCVDHRRFRFVRAEAPCWKGELQIGRLVFIWASSDPVVTAGREPSGAK
jgi:hypothetical protein